MTEHPRLMPEDFDPEAYEPTTHDLLTANPGRWVMLNGETPQGLAARARGAKMHQETKRDALGRQYARWFHD